MLDFVVRLAGVEPATLGLEVRIRDPPTAKMCRRGAADHQRRSGAFWCLSERVPGELSGELKAPKSLRSRCPDSRTTIAPIEAPTKPPREVQRRGIRTPKRTHGPRHFKTRQLYDLTSRRDWSAVAGMDRNSLGGVGLNAADDEGHGHFPKPDDP